MMRRSVVLPQPEGPSSEAMHPSRMAKLTSSSTGKTSSPSAPRGKPCDDALDLDHPAAPVQGATRRSSARRPAFIATPAAARMTTPTKIIEVS